MEVVGPDPVVCIGVGVVLLMTKTQVNLVVAMLWIHQYLR